MANKIIADTELTSIAAAIRSKGGTSVYLSFPDGFITAIENIQGGGGTFEEVPTSAEMDAKLISSNVGNFYLYTGPSTSSYINGRLYECKQN